MRKKLLLVGALGFMGWCVYLKYRQVQNLIQDEIYDNEEDGFLGVSLNTVTGGIMSKKASDLVSENYKGLLPIMENGIKRGLKGGRWYPYTENGLNPSIAFGHLILKTESFANGIELGEAYDLMLADIDSNCSAVVPFRGIMSDGFFDVFCDFAYNAGGGTFRKKIKPFLLQGLVSKAYEAMQAHYDAISVGRNAGFKSGWDKRQKYRANMIKGIYAPL